MSMRYTKEARKGYIDGIVMLYEIKSDHVSSFNATKNAVDRNDLNPIAVLRYNIKTKRDTDLNFAEAHDRTLSLKVVTPFCGKAEADQYAITDGVLYTIYHVDHERAEDCMYLYLEEVRKL